MLARGPASPRTLPQLSCPRTRASSIRLRGRAWRGSGYLVRGIPKDDSDGLCHTVGPMPDLIITNGDSAAELLAEAGKQGVILPWRDVLHEGPVVAGTLERCSAVRSAYLSARFRIPENEVADTFAERDGLLRRAAEFERIELWFEHDLFDQLQLVQILASLDHAENVTLVQANDFLGTQRADTILRFADRARPVERADLDTAAIVWSALASPTPEPIATLAETLDARLPYLKPALARFLQELPAPETGLGRTETAILDGISVGTKAPPRLFHEAILQEEAAFMGDASFYHLIDDLAFCEMPLIAGVPEPGAPDDYGARFRTAELELTMAGEEVANGEEDHVALSGIDRWWGGTHLQGRDVWRYDRSAGKLVAPGAA